MGTLPDHVIAADGALSRARPFTEPDCVTRVMSIRAAADVLGVSPTTVLRARHRRDAADAPDGMAPFRRLVGNDGKQRPNRRFDTTARDARIRERAGAGLSVRAIAAEVGCSVGTVHRVLKSGA
jgi:transposase